MIGFRRVVSFGHLVYVEDSKNMDIFKIKPGQF